MHRPLCAVAMLGLLVSLALSAPASRRQVAGAPAQRLGAGQMAGVTGGYSGACPETPNACNDADGCVGVFDPLTYYQHFPQRRCTWGSGNCQNSYHDWCYMVYNVSQEDCPTFEPDGTGTWRSCEAHCGASTGHSCTP